MGASESRSTFNQATMMHEEAEITINGAKLTDVEVRVVRLAIDALSNMLGERLGLTEDGMALSDQYMAAITKMQSLLNNGNPTEQ